MLRHLPDVARLINSVDKRAEINEAAASFLEYWRREEEAITIAVLRMTSAFSSSPLAPSRQAEEYRKRILFQTRSSSGIVLTTDWESALLATMESTVSYQPAVDSEVIAAVLKMVSLRLTKLYRNLSQLEELRELDEDFYRFVSSIPWDHEDVVRLVGYGEEQGFDFLQFEAGNGPMPFRSSYSRFAVPTSAILRDEVLERMRSGPWPIGRPDEYFSESWWLEHAIWQMVGREEGEWLDNLAMRIGDFNVIGPP